MEAVGGNLFLFVLTGWLMSFAGSLFFAPKMFSGEITPADPNVCTTQNVTFTSLLTQEPITNYSIGFTIKTRETHGTFVTVDQNRTEYMNETLSQFVYNVPPLNDVETANYFFIKSYYWQEFGDNNKTLQIGRTTSARVFPIPEKVVDFDCIVKNYATMTCSWKYGKDYGIHKPEVIFKWRIPSHTSSWTDCKYIDEENRFCTWNETRAGFFQNSNITIKLTLKQKCNIQADSEFHVDTSKIVKPNPVSNMKVYVINSTCLTLAWNTTESGPYYPKEHLIIASSGGDDVQNTTIITTGETEQLEHRETLCGLRPYTEYRFTVSIKPTGPFSGYFSDPVQQTAKTYSDIPSSSPKLIDGGYSRNHRDCEDGRERRRVCLFWKAIKPEHENGPMKGIEGSFSPSSPIQRCITEHWAEDVMYGCSDILCDTSYNFTIKARNVNGTSTQGSSITIPAFSKDTMRPNFIVESNGSDVLISWTYTGNIRASSVLVAWCRNENGDCKRGHEVGWKHANANETEVTLQIDTPQDFLYGVSAITGENDNTGVKWQDCVYLKNSLPKRKPQNVVVSTGSEDNSLVVTWDKLACTSNEPYITMYNIQYYKENDELRRSINVSGSGKARLVLKELDEDQTYVLTVRGITKSGIYGPESLPQTGVPVNKSLKSSEIVGITLAVLVCFIFAGIGVTCVIRRCKKTAEEVIKEAGNIKIPEVPELENSISLLRRASKDSGYDQTPLSDKKTVDYKLSNPPFNLPYDYRYVLAGQHDVYDVTGYTTYSLTQTPDNSETRKLGLFCGPSESDEYKGKQIPKLLLNIPKPKAFTSENGLYLSEQDRDTSDFQKERKRIDCERFSKSLGSLFDTNHNSIPCKHILPSEEIHDNDKENENASMLYQYDDKSNSYIFTNDHYVTNDTCLNRQLTNGNGLLLVDKNEPVPVITLMKCQENDDDKPDIGTFDLCSLCSECNTNTRINNPANTHDKGQLFDSSYVSTTDNRVLQPCATQTLPDTKSANSVSSGSVNPSVQDTGKSPLTSVIIQTSEHVQEPASLSTQSRTLMSAPMCNSINDTYSIHEPEQDKQGNDRPSILDITIFQNQLSGINNSLEPEESSSSSPNDDDILFSSLKQKPDIIDTSGYVTHCQTQMDQVKLDYSQDSTDEIRQERHVNMNQHEEEEGTDLNDPSETEQENN